MNYSPSYHSSSEHKLRYFWWNPRALRHCTDRNATDTFKAQKGSKDFVKTVHVTSVSNRNVMKQQGYLFMCKENKNNFIQWFLLSRISLHCHYWEYHKFTNVKKLQMNHWCHMDYLNVFLTTFLCLDRGRTPAVYGGSEGSRISSKIYPFVFQRWTKVLRVWNDMRVSK